VYCIYYPLMLPNSKPLNSKELLATSTSSLFQSLFCQLKLIVNNAMPHWLSFWICLLAGLYHRKNIRNEGKAQENCTRDGIPKFPRLIFIPFVYQIKFLCSPTPDLWLSQVHMYIPYAYQIKTVQFSSPLPFPHVLMETDSRTNTFFICYYKKKKNLGRNLWFFKGLAWW
jgi:hypothetical protein